MSRPAEIGYSPLAGQTELDDVVVPDWVAELGGGGGVRPVWRNGLGGITYRLGAGRFGAGERYLKVQSADTDWDLDAETSRLGWVGRLVPAPRVLDAGERGGERWLLTSGLPGRSAVDRGWRGRPAVAVPVLGRALRRFHDDVPVASCPFGWSVTARVGRLGLDPGLIDRTPELDAVVCHGDACNPNFLIDEDGVCSGYVDLGNLGVADRWADLAPALMSLGWNYGPGWERAFLDAYGIEPDAAKQAFYASLWDAED